MPIRNFFSRFKKTGEHPNQSRDTVRLQKEKSTFTSASPKIDSDERREQIGRRARRAAESILENEALTADLDDLAAKELINWGVTCAKNAAQSTLDLDDTRAEDAMSPRLRATRQLMRAVSNLVVTTSTVSEQEQTVLLEKIVEQARIIYGDQSPVPDVNSLHSFLKANSNLASDPAKFISLLRNLFEKGEDEIGAEHDSQSTPR